MANFYLHVGIVDFETTLANGSLVMGVEPVAGPE